MISIDAHTPPDLMQHFLMQREWLNPNEEILSVEKPGEGNMNVVLRVKTNERSFILKQSRPYVQKHQQIKAPLDRIAVEKKFYQSVFDNAVNVHIPKILGYDAEQYLLLLEDLGHCEDMTVIYKNKTISAKHLDRLVFILGLVHRKNVDSDFPKNLEMRRLNHQHIFVFPFLEHNDFQLDEIQPGLEEIALPYKEDTAIKSIVDDVGKKYLSDDGNTLIHGDYYPGSWMTEGPNLYIIDPEFGFVGFAEFDLGVMAAHIIMATGKKSFLARIHTIYQGEADKRLMSQVAGIEIMRRVMGLAQLPMDRTLKEKAKLLRKARKLILAS